MTTTTREALKTARVSRVCTSAGGLNGCGRVIQPREKYMRIKTSGIGDYGICECCANKIENIAMETSNA